MQTEMEKNIQREKTREVSFQKWMEKSEVKMIISMIPESANHEAFQVLIKSAFTAGHQAGVTEIAMAMIESFVDRKEKRDVI